MRNYGLLSFVAVAMALGLATVASADIAVISAIADTATTWEAKIRLWGDGGIGDPATCVGLNDFIIDVVGTGGANVDNSVNVSPQGEWTDPTGTVLSGFVDFRIDGGNGIGIVGTQPALYAPSGNDPRLDLAVFQGIGISDGTFDWTTVPDATGGTSASWFADTRVANGDYTGPGGVTANSYGLDSFNTLADTGGGVWTGPTSWGPAVTAVVIQDLTAGNNGGAGGYTTPSTLRVNVGSYLMNQNAGTAAQAGIAAVANLGVRMVDADTQIVLGADQDLDSLDVAYGNSGLQSVNLKRKAVRIYGGDLDTALADSNAAMANAALNPGDGIYDDTLSAFEGIGFGKVADANGDDHVLMLPTLLGDADLNRTVDFLDFGILSNPNNWQQSGKSWVDGDFNGDQVVDFLDFGLLSNPNNWQQTFDPTVPPAAPGGLLPEPTTLALLGLGAVAGLVRRRKNRQ